MVIPLGIAGYAVNPAGYHFALAMSDASRVGDSRGNTVQVLAWSAVIRPVERFGTGSGGKGDIPPPYRVSVWSHLDGKSTEGTI